MTSPLDLIQNKAIVPDMLDVDTTTGDVALHGLPVQELAEWVGTPAYILDEVTILNTIESYHNAYETYPSEVHPMYACKAHCNKALLQRVVAADMGLDLVSSGELATALAAELPAGLGLLNGNNKSYDELEYAIENDIGLISVDKALELTMIAEIAEKLGKQVNILLRITPGIECHTHDYIRTGSVDSKFGFNLADVMPTIERILNDYEGHIALRGLHSHIGSQIFEVAPFQDLASMMIGLYAQIRERFGITMTHLDIGGGFGIAYGESDDPPVIEAAGKQVCEALVAACAAHDFPTPELLIEPGRSIIGRAGMTLYTVGAIKDIPEINKTYVAVDGGMGDNIRPALYQASYSAVLVNKILEPATKKVTIAGKYCESGDILLKELMVPESIEAGDLLLVFSTGAYNYAMSSQYNRVPRPPVVMVDRDGELLSLVRRETIDDMHRLDD